MALFKFTKNIFEDKPIPIVFNHGNHTRDFTYIDDIVEVSSVPATRLRHYENWDSNHPNPATSNAPFRIFNIGNNRTVKLIEYIQAIEKAAGKEGLCICLPAL